MLSLVSNPGNSGGPLFDADGKVVGLLEGNLTSPMNNDLLGHAICGWVHIGADGQPVRDSSGQIQVQTADCLQNSGISYAVPAKFILELAEKDKTKNINLD